MSEHRNITSEEMAALLPDYEVSQRSWKRVKKRLLGRLALVSALYGLRLFIFVYYPEYHIELLSDRFVAGEDEMLDIGIYRSALLVFLLVIYLYAIYNNAYLRTVATIALIVTFALLWSDLESLLFYSLIEFQWYLILTFVVRIAVIYLLFKNYLDIRQ